MLTPTDTFVRTPQGLTATFDSASQLPSELKILLRAIDGHATLGDLSRQWKAWDSLLLRIEELQRAGLIVAKASANTANTRLASSSHPMFASSGVDFADATYPRGWPATVPMGLVTQAPHGQ